MRAQKWDLNILTETPFLEWNFFFESLLKIFYGLYNHVQGIEKVRLVSLFTSVKKLWPYDTPIKNYGRKREKKTLEMTSLQTTVGTVIAESN